MSSIGGPSFPRFGGLKLSGARSGSSCVRMLADFVAGVIRIESPKGFDPGDSMVGADRSGGDFSKLNGDTRSPSFNLKKPEGPCKRSLHRRSLVLASRRQGAPRYRRVRAIDQRIDGSEHFRLTAGWVRTRAGPGLTDHAGDRFLMSVTGFSRQLPTRAALAVSFSILPYRPAKPLHLITWRCAWSERRERIE
jgi:hypothetical protein